MLKKIIYKYFTLFMTLVVLTSSTGVGLVEHDCMIRGKSVDLIFKEKKKSCKLCRVPKSSVRQKVDSDAPVFKRLHCCMEKQQLKIVDYQVTLQKTNPGPFAADLSPAVIPTAFSFLFPERDLTIQEYALPPPVYAFSSLFSGRSLLVFVQSFLI